MHIPVIDLFAGPGGLGEGFESVTGRTRFEIRLSIEMERAAHKTLTLRSFLRQFERRKPADYYAYLRGEVARDTLFSNHPRQAEEAHRIAWCAELGQTNERLVDDRIREALRGTSDPWILIGGPPCQAYSLAGRSRNKGVAGYRAKDDHRHFLYREYLRILAAHQPDVFVMENVKGILSSRVDGELIFPKILDDLRQPCTAISLPSARRREHGYRIYSLSTAATSHDLWLGPEFKPADYVIRSEDFGIPQKRHRVILLGVRDDHQSVVPGTLQKVAQVSAGAVLKSLPRVRSGLSSGQDSARQWAASIQNFNSENWLGQIADERLKGEIRKTCERLAKPRAGRGGEFMNTRTKYSGPYAEWYIDPDLHGVCNHTSRGHILSDLRRYMFAACYGKVYGRSPTLKDFPAELLPAHKNARQALRGNLFADRFRVQLQKQPATTVTSHISKDGHYFIHPDASQCRSLTVREAARIQTFPDDYFFEGPRTAQYTQVGNAVPPLLARQLGEIVMDVLNQAGKRAA